MPDSSINVGAGARFKSHFACLVRFLRFFPRTCWLVRGGSAAAVIVAVGAALAICTANTWYGCWHPAASPAIPTKTPSTTHRFILSACDPLTLRAIPPNRWSNKI